MAIPSSGYSTASFTNPATDLTDFVAVVDLADMPADFWTAVSSSDGARGRAAKDDGTTELASEWVEFDDVAETGFVFFKWSGTLSSTGTSTVRIYPPQSGNSSYAVTATFGRNAVWSDYEAVFHLHQDPSGTAPQFTDATGNGNDLTTGGSMTSGDSVASVLGSGVHFDGTDDYAEITSPTTGLIDAPTTTAFTVSWWCQPDTLSNNPAALAWEGSDNLIFYPNEQDFPDGGLKIFWDNVYIFEEDGQDFAGTDVFYTFTQSSLTSRTAYRNNASVVNTDTTSSSGAGGFSNFRIGAFTSSSQFFDGTIDEVRVRSDSLSSDWISQEYDNQNDPTTFWGTWTWNAASGTSFTGSLSIGHTLGLTDSASASTSTAITNNQTLGMNEQARSDTAASLEQAFTLALNASSVFSFGGSFSIDIGYGNSITSQADTLGNIEGDASVTLHVAYAMTTAAQHSLLADLSIDISYASTNSASASTASTVTNDIQYVLDSLASAVASSGLTITHVSDISVGASSFTVDVTLSDGRTLSIRMQDRTEIIDSENRTEIIDSENRTLIIKP